MSRSCSSPLWSEALCYVQPFQRVAGCSVWAGLLQPGNPLAESEQTAGGRKPAQWEIRRSHCRDNFDLDSGAGTQAMAHPSSSRRHRRRSRGCTREEASLVVGDTGSLNAILAVWKTPCVWAHALNSESKKTFAAVHIGGGHFTSLSSSFSCEQWQARRSTRPHADSRGTDEEVCVKHLMWKLQYVIQPQFKTRCVLVST